MSFEDAFENLDLLHLCKKWKRFFYVSFLLERNISVSQKYPTCGQKPLCKMVTKTKYLCSAWEEKTRLVQ